MSPANEKVRTARDGTSRRRKRVQTISDKENKPSATNNRASQSTTKSRSRRKRKDDHGVVSDDTPLWNANQESTKQDDTIERFVSAQNRVAPSDLWNRHPSLAKYVVRASQAMPLKQNQHGALLLEEHCGELLNICRKCIKEASAKSSDDSARMERIYVAVHGLRAVSPLLVKCSSKWQSALKVLYHALMTSADICTASKSKSSTRQQSALQCLAAYQALGQLLVGHSLENEKNNSSKQLVLRLRNATKATNMHEMFPTPLSEKSRAAVSQDSSLAAQIFTIGIRSTLAVSSILSKLGSLSDGKQETLKDFGECLGEAAMKSQENGTLPFELGLRLVREVALPWISAMIHTEGEESAEEAVSYAKRAHRILWDAASQLDEHKPPAHSEGKTFHHQSLSLRKHAILALLLYDDKTSSTSSTRTLLSSKVFEVACTEARKAAMCYTQQASVKTPVSTRDNLYIFHTTVGNVLDSFAKTLGCGVAYLAYVEYCSCRAIHIGTQASDDGDRSCRQTDCIFGILSSRFAHRHCLDLSDSTALSGSGDDAYSITLALIFLLQRTREELGIILDPESVAEPVKDKKGKLGSICDRIIRRFRFVFFKFTELPAEEVCVRCFKLLALHSLPRLAFKILNETSARQDGDRSPILTGAVVDAVEVVGRILAECFAPLVVAIATNSPGADAGSGAQITVAAESYARAASLFDRLHSWSVAANHETAAHVDVPADCTFSDRADTTMRSLYRLLSGSGWDGTKPAVQSRSIELAAKTFESIGRRRVGRKEYRLALLPHVYSADLFSHLSSEEGSVSQDQCNYKLSLRFIHIASLFQALSMLDHAILAMLAGLLHGMLETFETSNHGVSAFQVLQACAPFTNGIVDLENDSESTSDTTSSLVCRLISLFVKRFHSAKMCLPPQSSPVFNGTDMSLPSLNKFLIGAVEDASTESKCLGSMKLADLLQMTLLGSGMRDDFIKHDERDVAFERMGVLFEALVYLGLELQRWQANEKGQLVLPDDDLNKSLSLRATLSDEDSLCSAEMPASSLSDALVEEFEEVIYMALLIVESLPNPYSDSLLIMQETLLYVVASSSLISSLLPYNFFCMSALSNNGKCSGNDRWQRSRELAALADKRANLLDCQIGEKHERLSYAVLRAALGLYYMQLHSIISEEAVNGRAAAELLSCCTVGVRLAIEISGRGEGRSTATVNLVTSAQFSLLCTLTKLEGILSAKGDKLHAAQASILALQLSQNEEILWNRALVASLLLSGGLDGSVMRTLEIPEPEWGNVRQKQHFRCDPVVGKRLNNEFQAVEFRLQLHSLDGTDARTVVKELKKLMCSSLDGRGESDALSLWVASTCSMALSEALESIGDVATSMTYSKQCYRICQDATLKRSAARASQKRNQSKWIESMMSLFPLRFAQRQFECLQRMALAYARLGNHKVSMQYAFSAADLCQLQLPTQTNTRVTFRDLLAERPCILRSIQQLACNRMLLELKAKASAPDKVYQALADRGERAIWPLLYPGSDRDGSPWSSETCREIEEIRNLLCLGDILSLGSHVALDNGYKQYYEKANMYAGKVFSTRMLSLLTSERPYTEKPRQIFTSLSCQLKLREAQQLVPMLNNDALSEKSMNRALELCMEITQSPYAPILCRAWAYYYMGLLELDSARRSGDLQLLWQHQSIGCIHERNTDLYKSSIAIDAAKHAQSIHLARRYFKDALSVAGPASQLLTRNAMRSLALAVGPEENDFDFGSTAAVLIHSSIGSTARQTVCGGHKSAVENNIFRTHDRSISNLTGADGTSQRVKEMFDALDSGFSNFLERSERICKLFIDANAILPPNWRFVAATLCPSGEVLLSSAYVCQQNVMSSSLSTYTVCIFPNKGQSQIYEDILRPLDDLIQRNQRQLGGMDNEKVSEQFSKESAKQNWWRERQEIDDELQSLLELVGNKYFGAECIRRLFIGTGSKENDIECSFDSEESSDLSCGNLALKFEAACTVKSSPAMRQLGQHPIDNVEPVEHYERSMFEKMTVVQIKEELDIMEVDKATYRKMRKAALIDLLIAEKERQNVVASRDRGLTEGAASANQSDRNDASVFEDDTVSDGCLFLILDENLHRFPFEGLDILADKAVSRIPSFPFAMAAILEAEAPSNDSTKNVTPFIDPVGTSYVIDPEANLSETKKRLVPVIEDFSSKNNWKWKGVVGSIPSSTFVEDALTKTNGLFLYCGHGGARSIYSRRQLESLMHGRMQGDSTKDDSTLANAKRQCRSTVILMGCSSGRLVSVNRKDSESSENLPIFYEPEGIALSYLCAGAPCVVGNLWDVTDRDIDRYCISLLRQFLTSDEEGRSLARCVADSRSACKMRYIVGCAPVCYGVPVHCLPNLKGREKIR